MCPTTSLSLIMPNKKALTILVNKLNAQFKAALIDRKLDVLEALLEVGVSADTTRDHERTALMRAAEFNDTELTLLLLSYDAWPLAEDEDGDNPLAIALRNKHEYVARLLARRILYNQLVRFHKEGDDIDNDFTMQSGRYACSMLESLIIYGFPDLFKHALQLGFVPFEKLCSIDTEWQESLLDASIHFDSMIALAQQHGQPEIEKAIVQWHYGTINFDKSDVINPEQWGTYMSMFEKSLSVNQKQWIPNVLADDTSVLEPFVFVPLAGDIPKNIQNSSGNLDEGDDKDKGEYEDCPF